MSEATTTEPIGVTTTQSDNGETNQRLLSREVKTDFRRVESASRKIRTTLQSPEGKRLFLRFFDGASLNLHFISVIAPINLPAAEVESAMAALEELLEKNTALLNDALVHAEQLCHRNGIVDLATYDIAPLVVDARVHSRFGRRYLELICKVDQLMQILETLVIDEVMPNGEMTARKAKAKRAVRSIGSAIRQTRFGLHKRINALQAKQGATQTIDRPDAPQDASEQLSAAHVSEVTAVETQSVLETSPQLEIAVEK